MISSVITLMSVQTTELLGSAVFVARSRRSQTVQNHTLALTAPANYLESHSCEKQGGGVPQARTCLHLPAAGLRVGLVRTSSTAEGLEVSVFRTRRISAFSAPLR